LESEVARGKVRESPSERAKPYASQIKAKLTAARDVSVAKEARGDESARPARLSLDPEVLGRRRVVAELVRDFAVKSGFESTDSKAMKLRARR
jgi:hypothetical protein